jgi:thioredoxin reductase
MLNDVIVVGGSFAGLSGALQLARARRRVLVIDSGQPRNRFAQASHGFFGQDGVSPFDAIHHARKQLLAYPTVQFIHDLAQQARKIENGFEIALAGGERHSAARLILATGVVDDLLEVPGLKERWGVSVLHCHYCHGYEVAGRRLGLLATSERSLPAAMLLPDWSSHVTLFTNGVLALEQSQLEALNARGVKLEHEAVSALVGDSPALAGVKLSSGRVVPIDALFTGSRTRMASPLAEQLGCQFEEGPSGSMIRTDTHKETTVRGVFAAGDAARATHNATWASADGVTAGISAHQSLVLSQVACT